MCLPSGGGDNFLREEYERQRAEEEARQARITEGKAKIDEAFAGYDDQFYADRAADYLDYATPQIEDQYTDAMRGLTRALARSGLSQSSVAAERKAKIEKTLADAQANAAREGEGYANQVRQSLASVKNNLHSQNQALADPTLIASMAANQASAASVIPTYNPVAQLFANAADGLATQQQLEARNKNRYEMAELFDLGGGSGRVVSS